MKSTPDMVKSKCKGCGVEPVLVNLFDERSVQTSVTATERRRRSTRGDEVVETGRGPL